LDRRIRAEASALVVMNSLNRFGLREKRDFEFWNPVLPNSPAYSPVSISHLCPPVPRFSVFAMFIDEQVEDSTEDGLSNLGGNL
jgi:hypothetical protein